MGRAREGDAMADIISDEMIEKMAVLSELSLTKAEKERAKKDIGKILDYMDKLGELDTSGIEPLSHVFPVCNVFREDIVTNGDGREDALANAPAKQGGGFEVPGTFS